MKNELEKFEFIHSEGKLGKCFLLPDNEANHPWFDVPLFIAYTADKINIARIVNPNSLVKYRMYKSTIAMPMLMSL